MSHTARQHSWADAAEAAESGLAAGLFALLSEPNEAERAAGITTSPLTERAAADPPATLDPDELAGRRACVGCGMLAEPGDVYCAGCRSARDRGSNPADWPPAC